MLDEYDFSGAERGRFHMPFDQGYTVEIHMEDGSTRRIEGKLMSAPSQPDTLVMVRQHGPRSSASRRVMGPTMSACSAPSPEVK